MTTGIHIQFGYKVIAIPHMALWVWYAKMFSGIFRRMVLYKMFFLCENQDTTITGDSFSICSYRNINKNTFSQILQI
jgi:hypothetical protein